MPNIKQKKKRVITNEISRQRNVSRRSAMKTATKKVVEAAEKGAPAKEVATLFRAAESQISRAASKGLIKKNTASRSVSRLSARVATSLKGAKDSAEFFFKAEAPKKKAAPKKAAAKKAAPKKASAKSA